MLKNKKIGGAVFLAGWIHLTDKAYETKEDVKIAKPWLETPLNWNVIKSRTNKFTGIFSDDDPFVPISDAQIFENNLEAKIIIEHKKKHFGGNSGIKKLPSALCAILEIAEKKR